MFLSMSHAEAVFVGLLFLYINSTVDGNVEEITVNIVYSPRSIQSP